MIVPPDPTAQTSLLAVPQTAVSTKNGLTLVGVEHQSTVSQATTFVVQLGSPASQPASTGPASVTAGGAASGNVTGPGSVGACASSLDAQLANDATSIASISAPDTPSPA